LRRDEQTCLGPSHYAPCRVAMGPNRRRTALLRVERATVASWCCPLEDHGAPATSLGRGTVCAARRALARRCHKPRQALVVQVGLRNIMYLNDLGLPEPSRPRAPRIAATTICSL